MSGPKRGEIYFVNLNPTKGREQAGNRPALVLSIDAINMRPLVVTVIVGTKGENLKRDYRTNVRVPASESGLPLETVFLGFQCGLLTPRGFRHTQQVSFQRRNSRKLRMRFGTA